MKLKKNQQIIEREAVHPNRKLSVCLNGGWLRASPNTLRNSVALHHSLLRPATTVARRFSLHQKGSPASNRNDRKTKPSPSTRAQATKRWQRHTQNDDQHSRASLTRNKKRPCPATLNPAPSSVAFETSMRAPIDRLHWRAPGVLHSFGGN